MIDKLRLDELCTPKSSNLAQKDIQENDGDYPVYGASGFIKNINFYHQESDYIAVVKDGAGIGRAMFLPAKSSIIGTMQYLIPKNNVDPKYLYYAVKGMNLSKYYSGATIPHIYFKDYKKESVPLYSKDQQKMISRSLEKVEELIIKKQQLLNEYDQLIKSRFVEMFDGRDSRIEKLTNFVYFQEGPGVRTVDFTNEGTILLTGSNINNNEISFGYKSDRFISNELAFGKYAHFMCDLNDILVVSSAIAPEKFDEKVVIVKEDKKYCLNTGIIRFKPNLKFLTRRYFVEFLKSEYFKKQVAKNMKGIAQMHFGPSHLKTMSIIVPNSLEKQIEFETFAQQVDKLKFVEGLRLMNKQELLNL